MKILDNKKASLIVPDFGLYLVQSRYTLKKYIAFVPPIKPGMNKKYRMVHIITDNEYIVSTVSYSWLVEKYNIFYRIKRLQLKDYEEFNSFVKYKMLKDGVYVESIDKLIIVKDKLCYTIDISVYSFNEDLYYRLERETIIEYADGYTPENITYKIGTIISVD